MKCYVCGKSDSPKNRNIKEPQTKNGNKEQSNSAHNISFNFALSVHETDKIYNSPQTRICW